MKKRQVTAMLLSAVLTLSSCLSAGGMTALASESAPPEEAAQEETAQDESGSAQEADTAEEETGPVQAEVSDVEKVSEPAQEAAGEDAAEDESAQEDAAEDEVIQQDVAENEAVQQEAPEEEPAAQEAAEDDSLREEVISAQEEAPEKEETGSDDSAEEAEEAQPAARQSEEAGTREPLQREDSQAVQGSAESAESYYSFDTAWEITLGESVHVDVTEENPRAYLKFTPEEDGFYAVYSSGNEYDTYGTLYASDGETVIDNDDEGGLDSNFKIKAELEAGETYYIEARQYGFGEASFDVYVGKVNFSVSAAGDTEILAAPGEEVTLSVNASSDAALHYSWYIGGEMAEAAVSDSFSFIPEKNGYVQCEVSDDNGETESISFHITIENHFKAWPEGAYVEGDYKAGQVDLTVPFGEGIVLKTNVSADDMNGISYTWRDPDGVKMEGENSDTCSIDSAVLRTGQYSCIVYDAYGNISYAAFVVHFENHLKAWPEGAEILESGPDYIAEYAVSPGEGVTLKANVTADDMNGITYTWYNPDYYQIEGEESAACFIDAAALESGRYKCEINDNYGNNSVICFDITIENHLEAWPEGAEEDEDGKADSVTITASPGEDLVLRAVVTADDMDGITYTWVDPHENYSENEPDSITVDASSIIQGEYICIVMDAYGNDRYVHFFVQIENHLEAWPEGAEEDEDGKADSVTITASPGEDLVLRAVVTADDMDGITYTWVDPHENYSENEPDSITVDASSIIPGEYVCIVMDAYGNDRYVHFFVQIENHLEAWPEGAEDNTFEWVDYRVSPGEGIVLKTNVTADNMNGITYTWYDTDDNYLGEGSDSYSIDADMLERGRYRCIVEDSYGNQVENYFYIYFENHLEAWPEGAEEDEDGKATYVNITAAPGEDLVLKTNVAADDLNGITYKWEDENYYEIEGETSDTLSIDGNALRNTTFRCCVFDAYGNEVNVNFNVHIENHFSAWPEGADEDEWYIHHTVYPGESITMKVNVTADDLSGISYFWYDSDNYIEGVTSDTYSIDGSLVKSGPRRCEVLDKYGNRDTVYFYIGVENHLEAWPEGASGPEGEKDSYVNCYVEPGDGITLKVNATADDMSGITYSWQDSNYNDMEGYVSDEIYLDAASVKSGNYECRVGDPYGNYLFIDFYVTVTNDLDAYAYGTDHKDYVVIDVDAAGDSAQLRVVATAKDTSALRYEWMNEDDRSIIENADTDTYTVESVSGKQDFTCTVTDQYQNSATVDFCVGLPTDEWVKAYEYNYDEDAFYPDYYIGEEADLYVKGSALVQGKNRVLRIDRKPWYYNDSIRSITFEKGVEFPDDSYGMFRDMSNLERLDLSKIDFAGVSEADRMFQWDTSLQTIDTPLHVGIEIALPALYEDANGVEYTILPMNQDSSIRLIYKAALPGSESGDPSVSGDPAPADPVSIEDCTITVADVTYTGEAQTPDVTVVNGETTLSAGTDYTVSYSDNTNAGTATVTVTGTGNYTGTAAKTFTINAADIAGCTVTTEDTGFRYTGKVQTPAVTVADGDTALAADTDYTVSYSDNINAGTATVTVTGIGNYTGTAAKTFTIDKADVADFTVTAANAKYTGKAQTPAVTVVNGSTTLKADTDYTVIYSNNINAGTATVTVTGIGNYTGTAAKTFTIQKGDVADCTITAANAKYTGEAQTPAVTVVNGNTTLKADTDYTVVYSNNINAGTATVTVTGIGNYTGTAAKNFTISKAAQTFTFTVNAAARSVGQKATAKAVDAKGSVTFKSSNTTVATISSTGVVTANKVGTVTITATAAATTNYAAASKSVTFKVTPAAPAKVTLTNQVTGIKLTWSKVAGANGYYIYRNNAKIKVIASGSTVTFADTKANTNGTKYTYKIVARGTTGVSNLSRSAVIYRIARPSISSLTNSAAGRATAKWTANAKSTGYQIQYSLRTDFTTGTKTITIANRTAAQKVLTGLAKGKTYRVRMRTYRTVGGNKYYSLWSPLRSVKITK